jgi:hypothetical protein
VVSLAHPDIVPSQASFAPASRGRLRWPVLRWGALVACVAVVGAAVSLRQWTAKHEAMTVYTDASATPKEQVTADKTQATALPESKLAEKLVQPSPEANRQVTDQLAKRLDQDAAKNGRLNARIQQEEARPASKPVLPSTSETAEVAAAETMVQSAPASTNQVAKLPIESRDEIAEVISGKAKDERTKALGDKKQGMVAGALASEMAAGGLAKSRTATFHADAEVADRWVVSSSGALERSYDAGKTWQTVPVASNVVFRAVAAVGIEVWAGGVAGALYHSRDLGQHWTEVKPTSDGKNLSSEIVTIEFADFQHGKLTTAAGETWITADGGQSWQKK